MPEQRAQRDETESELRRRFDEDVWPEARVRFGKAAERKPSDDDWIWLAVLFNDALFWPLYDAHVRSGIYQWNKLGRPDLGDSGRALKPLTNPGQGDLTTPATNPASDRLARLYANRRAGSVSQGMADFTKTKFGGLDTKIKKLRIPPQDAKRQWAKLLDEVFGPKRAQDVAITETTGALSAGEMTILHQLEREGWAFKIVIQTARDERVCPVCGPLDGVDLADVIDQLGDVPFHVRCRCWKRYVVVSQPGRRLQTVEALLRRAARFAEAFCPTGKGGGVNPHCSPTQFNSYADAEAYMRQRQSAYKNKNEFLSSAEYRNEIYPAMQAAYQREKSAKNSGLAAAGATAMQSVGAQAGQRVRYDVVSPYGVDVEPLVGTIVMRKGVPFVKLDAPASNGKKSVRWHKGFSPIKESEVREEFCPTGPGGRG